MNKENQSIKYILFWQIFSAQECLHWLATGQTPICIQNYGWQISFVYFLLPPHSRAVDHHRKQEQPKCQKKLKHSTRGTFYWAILINILAFIYFFIRAYHLCKCKFICKQSSPVCTCIWRMGWAVGTVCCFPRSFETRQERRKIINKNSARNSVSRYANRLLKYTCLSINLVIL